MATAFSPGSTATASTAAGLTPAGRPIDIPRICESFDRAQHPKVSRVGNHVEITTTPKFGDLTQYGVSEENEKRVWAAEVRRLAAAVTDPGITQLEGPAEWYGGDADANGYSCLHDLAHSFQMALEICTHDDLIVASKSHPQQDYSHPIALSYNRLERNFDDKIQRRKFEHLGRGGNRAFHAFVNYVTATVAIVLLRTTDDDLWADNCLASLAQFASKMKVVGYDLPITTAISMAVFLRSQPLLSPIKFTNPMDLDPQEAEHIAPLIAFNQTVQQLLRDATATLLWDATTGQPSDMFETSAVLYDTGFHGARRQLCQERNRRIGSSAGRSTVRSASVVFDVCRAIWSDIPDDDRPVPCRTYVDWSWTSKNSNDKDGKGIHKKGAATRRRSLTNMKDVISVLVPYTMFCGPFPSTLAALVSASSDKQTPTTCPEPSTHLASVRIRTSQYTWLEAQMQDQYENHGPPHKNVYDTALAQERALARSEDDSMIDDDIKQRRYREMNERLREATAQMANWTIGPHSITINDNWYCRTTFTAISLLVLGALALIFIAGRQPLAGVDRPNLVVLVWTAAGFLMAYVKSTRVEAWPWHDFLRGQVVCRSISEIHAVTKINPQTLLAVLLWNANSMTISLRTSGPFCSLFGEHESGGFDIDIAPLNDTAMAGGHLFVVVSTHDGPALVDLVAQADAESYTSVPNAGSNTTTAHLRDALYCINAGSPDHFLTFIREKDETGSTKTRKMFLPMYRLSDNGVLEWNRVLGVLDERAIFRLVRKQLHGD
ncbi:hypothetical protein F503_00003 [Ophiostoma piceae UAMH 11346]|uniref:Uncharacterized protein n=1 Tax=Ophiostoma piceae (strain UAMH 11346) TaxID=1262450 RepID=S3BUA8_OPHP1|nr:hypothetical protein F503_00003 [Ophiostoma piceae UAMH 11346]